MLPPGRAKLATSPAVTGSSTDVPMTIGIVLVASLAARVTEVFPLTITSTLAWTSSGDDLGDPLESPLGRPALDHDVLPLHLPRLAQSLKEGAHVGMARLGASIAVTGVPPKTTAIRGIFSAAAPRRPAAWLGC